MDMELVVVMVGGFISAVALLYIYMNKKNI